MLQQENRHLLGRGHLIAPDQDRDGARKDGANGGRDTEGNQTRHRGWDMGETQYQMGGPNDGAAQHEQPSFVAVMIHKVAHGQNQDGREKVRYSHDLGS